MNALENILLIRLKSIGDIVFTLPAVHAVRENFPDANFIFSFRRNMRNCCGDLRRWGKTAP